jgi:putative phage-type endonuclease
MNPLQDDQWLENRLGFVTASKFSDVLAKGQGKTRRSYMLKLAAERITGKPIETYKNDAMERGIELEEQARNEYEFITGNTVELSGFVKIDDDTGCSPDGLVGDKGLVEIKCPLVTTHIEYVLAGKLPPTYKAQVMGQLWVTGREWCDFVSYCPDVKSDKYIMIVRVERDESYIDNLRKEVFDFITDLRVIETAMS